jgi:hypothetical protein
MFAGGRERCADLRLWGVAAAACSVSLGLLQQHGLLAFAPAITVAHVAVLIGVQATLARSRGSARGTLVVAWLTAGLALWLFRARYPEWNVRVDRDEALDLAVCELLSGRPPYRVVTQLGNPVSPLPGSLVLALPFVLLGSSAYQNWGWGALALWSVARCRGYGAALLALAATFGSLAFTQEWLFGGDLITVALASAGAVAGVVAAVDRPRLRALASVVLGIALLSRPNLAFVFVSLLAWALRTRNARTMLPMLGLAASVAGGLLAAFYLWDPLHFTPFHVVHKLDHGNHRNLASAVSATMLLAAGTLGATRWYRGPERVRLFLELALVQAVPLFVMVIAQSIGAGHVTFSFLKERYGVVPFVWAVVAWLFSSQSSRPACFPSCIVSSNATASSAILD